MPNINLKCGPGGEGVKLTIFYINTRVKIYILITREL
jgi:hypothetical protein